MQKSTTNNGETGLSKCMRITSLLLGLFQNLLFGGILYGWPAISGVLLQAKPTEGGPGLTSDYVEAMFVTAAFFNFLGPFLLGIVLDGYGPRACSVLSFFIITLGCALFSISNVPNLPLFAPAMSMIAFGGPGVQTSIIHLSNLFPGNKATATALITMSFQISFAVFGVFDNLWFYFGTDYQTLFLGYGCLSAISMLLSLLVYPDEPYHYDELNMAAVRAAANSRHMANYIAGGTSNKSLSPLPPTEPEMMGMVRMPSRMIRLEKVLTTTIPSSSSVTPNNKVMMSGGFNYTAVNSQAPSSGVSSALLGSYSGGSSSRGPSPHPRYDGSATRSGSHGQRPVIASPTDAHTSEEHHGNSPTPPPHPPAAMSMEKWAALAAQGKADAAATAAAMSSADRSVTRKHAVLSGSRHGKHAILSGSRHGDISTGLSEIQSERRRSGVTANKLQEDIAAMVIPKTPVKDLDLHGQMTSNTFIYLTVFFVVTSFWANFMVGTLHMQLGDSKLLPLTADGQQLYGRYFSLIMTTGALAIPVVGFIMDKGGFPVTWTITVAVGVLWSLLLLYDSEWTLLPSFFCYAVFRTLLYTFLFAYIADTMGFRYFGVLAGLMFVISGIVGLLQYPLAKWAEGTCHLATTALSRIHCSRGNWLVVNLMMTISMLTMFWLPYRDWIRRRRHLQAVEAGSALLRSSSKMVSVSLASGEGNDGLPVNSRNRSNSRLSLSLAEGLGLEENGLPPLGSARHRSGSKVSIQRSNSRLNLMIALGTNGNNNIDVGGGGSRHRSRGESISEGKPRTPSQAGGMEKESDRLPGGLGVGVDRGGTLSPDIEGGIVI